MKNNQPFLSHSRRQFLRQAAYGSGMLTLGGIWMPTAFAAALPSSKVVETDKGKVRGYVNEGVSVFKGIPYGDTTAGANRFLPPRPAPAWTGVRESVSYGSMAPQSLSGDALGDTQGEDCLVINVWTPEANDNKKRPVMFWCHGGGFSSLSGSSPSYDGTNLCNRGDVVVVTVNHRLNVMGFAHMESVGGDAFKNAGAAGMLDLVAALKWVQKNITQFGGDPDNVMIFGESGGGRKVGTLLAMPEAKGLFHRAVIQSGPSTKLVAADKGEYWAKALFNELGIKPGNMKAIQEVPVAKIIAAYGALVRKPGYNAVANGFAPVVDGDAIPYSSFDPVASPVNPDVPVIVGCNRTELALQMRSDQAAFNLNESQLKQRIAKLFPNNVDEVIDVYRQAEPKASPSELFFLIVSDDRYVVPCNIIAERRAALKKQPVYFYYLTWETKTYNGRLMTPHALDIPFVFDNTDKEKTVYGLTTGTAEERALADKVSDTWIAFARTGNPNAGKLPQWKPYSADARMTMVIDNDSQLVDDPIQSRRDYMSNIITLY